MIEHFTDHAANERTFLAWVRTSIAIMAFGFLVERFGLFLKIAARTLGSAAPPASGFTFGSLSGLILIVAGMIMIGGSAYRFVRTSREIDSPNIHKAPGARFDMALASMLVILGIALVIYLSHALGGAV
ncbi:MAG: hypothetical protein B7Z78_12495 [Rhodospirillales bacterium 20-60-12]|nr:MAG: hypothetical protein B7Z78_12495 [Rhodospirillales bacterium 20-60-12]OYV58148.1 MAG: hypothetical protein B7X01_04010 [Acidiphilium sp. 21-62-4]HQT68405.1 DUF202 domain-containing protein [Acetobacteraceae bacterium]HQU01081.1 DUF202 domain-containing protein [Acetobacteraceae bacterium]